MTNDDDTKAWAERAVEQLLRRCFRAAAEEFLVLGWARQLRR